jgi:hypothetical protein
MSGQARPHPTGKNPSLLPGRQSRRWKGLAGENLALSHLFLNGYEAWQTRHNARDVDIIAANPDTQKVAFIQVKTTDYWYKNKWPEWHVKPNVLEWSGERLFYAFVDLRDQEKPRIYIVPSSTVCNVVSKCHDAYCKDKGKDPEELKKTGRMCFYFKGHPGVENYGLWAPSSEESIDRWGILGLD